MNEISMSKVDELVMKLLHYFTTVENYTPIVLKGAKDEIWLEKLNGDYKIVRIASNYIHNTEQLNMDLYRTKQIMKKIKKKTMSFNINALNLFVNLGENANIEEVDIDDIDAFKIDDIEDFKKYDMILDKFPTITKKCDFKEDGVDLFMKITDEISKKNETDQKQAEDIFSIKDPLATKILLSINFVAFLLMYLIPNDLVFNLGVLHRQSILSGEFYRIFTAMFLHSGLIHFFFNMYAIYIVGPQIENFFGKFKFILIYLGSGIMGSLLSLIFIKDSVGLGASGAIFGLLGSLLYFGYHYRIYLDSVIKSQIIPLIVANLLIGFIIPGIDNAAHIGGLIGGILMSYAVGVKYKSTQAEKTNGIILTTIFTGFLVYLVFFM